MSLPEDDYLLQPKMYMYVPDEDVIPSLDTGVLSPYLKVRDGQEKKVVEKHELAYNRAMAESPEFVEYMRSREPEDVAQGVICYLDWRTRGTESLGSRGFYCLATPIPSTAEIDVYMKDFLRNHTLFEFTVGDINIHSLFCQGVDVLHLQNEDIDFWVKCWMKEIERAPLGSTEYKVRDPFENIPHALVVPGNGVLQATPVDES